LGGVRWTVKLPNRPSDPGSSGFSVPQQPLDAWRGGGFLPRFPESLEDFDLLLGYARQAAPRAARWHPSITTLS
jgi:hypothetical protein